MIRRALPALALLAAACAPALKPLPATAPTLPLPSRIARVRELARLAEHEPDPESRQRLAVEAVETAQPCLADAPDDATCSYWLAVAIGLQARERPTTASDGIPRMLALLERADAADPGLERGGPARVRALVLLRAPGWPLGPGDPEAGLEAARRAMAIDAAYPPNRIALAEALRRTGNVEAARAEALAAERDARASEDPDAPDWIRDAGKLSNER